MKYTAFLLMPVLLLGSGCSTKLKVTVNVLDRDYWNHTSAAVAEQVQLLEARVLKNRGIDAYNTIGQEILSATEILYDSLNASGDLDQEDVLLLSSTSTRNTSRQLTTADSLYDQALRQITRARKAESEEARRTLFLEAKGSFLAGDSVLVTLTRNVQLEFEGKLAKYASSLGAGFRALLLGISRKNSRAMTSLTQDGGLLDDVLAPLVINAPKDYWKGSFNETFAKTKLGNADIAIVMESLGEYTIKGVRLDASKVTEATFKTLTQSIQFVAAASGLSMQSADTSSTGNALNEITRADQQRQQAETLQRLSRLSSVALLDAILNNRGTWSDAEVEPDALQTAVSTLKKTFSVYRSQLSPEVKGD